MQGLIFTLIFMAIPMQAQMSFGTVLQRCTEDNLVPAQAKLRNKWTEGCFPEVRDYLEFFSTKSVAHYALVQHKSGSWIGPVDTNAPCEGWTIKSFCVASCYTPDQRILFESGYWPIIDALSRNERKLLVLQKNSSLQNPLFEALEVEAYSRSWQAGHEAIRVIQTQSGKKLEVTENHPVLLSSGVMVEARELQIGDILLQKSGIPDPILALQDKVFFGAVYNLSPKSLDPVSNILVAEDLLVGSAGYQYTESLHSLVGRKFMRSLL